MNTQEIFENLFVAANAAKDCGDFSKANSVFAVLLAYEQDHPGTMSRTVLSYSFLTGEEEWGDVPEVDWPHWTGPYRDLLMLSFGDHQLTIPAPLLSGQGVTLFFRDGNVTKGARTHEHSPRAGVTAEKRSLAAEIPAFLDSMSAELQWGWEWVLDPKALKPPPEKPAWKKEPQGQQEGELSPRNVVDIMVSAAARAIRRRFSNRFWLVFSEDTSDAEAEEMTYPDIEIIALTGDPESARRIAQKRQEKSKEMSQRGDEYRVMTLRCEAKGVEEMLQEHFFHELISFR